MRRMSIWVVGVPLPGWKLSALQNDIELAIVALDDIALANRTCDDFHDCSFLDCGGSAGRQLYGSGGPAAERTIAIPRRSASPVATRLAGGFQAKCGHEQARFPWWSPHVYADRRPFLKARERIMRAGGHFFETQASARWKPRFSRFRPATRRISALLRPSSIAPDGGGAALSAGIAGIFLQETAGGRGKRLYCLRQVFRNRERGVCIIPNSPCSNGIGRANPMTR